MQNEITIIYKVKDKKRVKIFGKYFVENNMDKCKIKINDRLLKLREYYSISIKTTSGNYNNNKNKIENRLEKLYLKKNDEYKNYIILNKKTNREKDENKEEILEIKLIGINKLTNMSSIFEECKLLLSLPDISSWNTSNITEMSDIFFGCESLLFLSDISKWNTSKVTHMSHMFSGCKSLLYLPDISKWNTSNVQDMSFMFEGCKSLLFLPDISKWNTYKLWNMNGMFSHCVSLLYLPNINKWKSYFISYNHKMFFGCINCINISYFI